MIRYDGEGLGDARSEGQVTTETDTEKDGRAQQKKGSSPSRPRTSGQGPGRPAPGDRTSTKGQQQELQVPDIRPRPGHPALAPDIRPSAPDIRHIGARNASNLTL